MILFAGGLYSLSDSYLYQKSDIFGLACMFGHIVLFVYYIAPKKVEEDEIFYNIYLDDGEDIEEKNKILKQN
jgi:hypothetical protein